MLDKAVEIGEKIIDIGYITLLVAATPLIDTARFTIDLVLPTKRSRKDTPKAKNPPNKRS